MLDLTAHRQLIARSSGLRFQGRVVQVVGLSIEVEGLRLPLGEICHLYPERATAGASRITAEVVGFRDERLILMPSSRRAGRIRVRSRSVKNCSVVSSTDWQGQSMARVRSTRREPRA